MANLPSLSEEKIKDTELSLIESKDPRILLDGSMLFLGEIPKRTDFEKGSAEYVRNQDGF